MAEKQADEIDMTEMNDLERAKAAIRANNREKAWRLLHRHITLAPEDVEAWLMLGGLAEADKRLVYLRRAEELAPDNPNVKQALVWAKNQAASEKTQRKPPLPVSEKHVRVSIEREKTAQETKQTTGRAPMEAQTGSSKPQDFETGPVKAGAEEFHPQASDGVEPQTKKPLNLLKNAGFLILVLALMGLLAIGIFFRVQGQEPVIFGYKIVIVTSGSMEPVFQAGSIILINTQAEPPFEVGDVVMFAQDDDPDMNITHRIIDTYESEGVRYYQTKGDNNLVADQEEITNENIFGAYANFTLPYLGYFFSFIRSREGMLLIAMLFGLYLVISQVFRIRAIIAEEETSNSPEQN